MRNSKLLYIDNDRIEEMDRDLVYVKGTLKEILKTNLLPEIDLIPSFGHKSKNEKLDILFDPDNIIVTWSMYTINPDTETNSGKQLLNYLNSVGRNEVKNKVYIDCSGEIRKFLNRNIDGIDTKISILKVLRAIEQNYIITIDRDKNQIGRLRLDLSNDGLEKFKIDDFDLKILNLKV